MNETEDGKIIDETIRGLIECDGHLDKRGCRDYDKVPYGIVEDAITLLQHYKQVLDCLKEIRKEKRVEKIIERLNPV